MKRSLRYGFKLVNTTDKEIADIIYGACRVFSGNASLYKAKLFTGAYEGEIVFTKSTHNTLIADFELAKQSKSLCTEITSISMNKDDDNMFASVRELIAQYHDVKYIETKIRVYA